MNFSVEPALPADNACIEALLDLSFGLNRQTKTSYRLREGSHAIEGLSFVVRDKALGIVGAISFWPLKIGVGGTDAVLLGPLAVHPNKQNLGIGLALMRQGISRARELGHRLIILVGDVPYYARLGFKCVPNGQIVMPGPVDPARLLYLELEPAALTSAAGLVMPPHRYKELVSYRPSRNHMEQTAASAAARANNVADSGYSVAASTR